MKSLQQSIPSMSIPIDVGTFDQYCYLLVSYIEGEQAEIILPTLPLEQQYQYGIEAGKLLRQFHDSLPCKNDKDWVYSYNKKIDQRIDAYYKSEIPNVIVDKLISFVNSHRHLITNDHVSWQHGDYHVGNLIIHPDGSLNIIDFNRIKWGDPYYEFNRIFISSQFSTEFAKGQIDGYFGGSIPDDFFIKMKFYASSVLIGTLVWASNYSEKDIEFALNSLDHLYNVYNHFNSTIPNWYK